MKRFTLAILGCGNRGTMFARAFQVLKEQFEIVAFCDKNPSQIKRIHTLYGFEKVVDYYSNEEFLKEKRADALVIATDDRYHVPQCLRALELGYDVLLEKPISDNRKELYALLDMQKKTGRKVVVCHELRYGAGYIKCAELLKSGVIGKLYAIDASERVVYWHWAQAYVRGMENLADPSVSHPAILAKCSHDLDLIQSYAQSKCDTVSSIGSRFFFTPEHAPDGATEWCLDCPHIQTCPYSAKRVYVDAWHEAGEPVYGWPYNKATLDAPFTEEKLLAGLRTRAYGKCVFFINRDLVDHQFVQMRFQNGVTASLKMVYGATPGRRITFYGTHGEIQMDERLDELSVMPYGGATQTLSLCTIVEGGNAHGGGDGVLIRSFYGILTGEIPPLTSLEESLECHLIGIAAEESRKRGGELVVVHK